MQRLAAGFLALFVLTAIPAQAQRVAPVDVSRLRSSVGAEALGHGPIVMAAGDPADSGQDSGLPLYEAAVQAQLARAGYDTVTTPASGTGQIVEIRVIHDELQPAEAPRKPISGAMSTTVSNRGSGFGLALGIDLTKPKKALVGTRLEVRIRDRATNRVLWEGKARTASRETEDGLANGRLADRMTAALFAGFPAEATVVPVG